MYKNLFTIHFNLTEVARELRRHNIQFSMNNSMISILPISLHITDKYIGIYQDGGKHKLLFKEDSNLCNLILSLLAECKTIKTKTHKTTASVFDIQILITKDNITVMQNGKIL